MSIKHLLLTVISMHSKLLICVVNKQGIFEQEKKYIINRFFSFPAAKTELHKGEYYRVSCSCDEHFLLFHV